MGFYLDNNESWLAFDLLLAILADLDNVLEVDQQAAVELARKFKYDLWADGDGLGDGSMPVAPVEYVHQRLWPGTAI